MVPASLLAGDNVGKGREQRSKTTNNTQWSNSKLIRSNKNKKSITKHEKSRTKSSKSNFNLPSFANDFSHDFALDSVSLNPIFRRTATTLYLSLSQDENETQNPFFFQPKFHPLFDFESRFIGRWVAIFGLDGVASFWHSAWFRVCSGGGEDAGWVSAMWGLEEWVCGKVKRKVGFRDQIARE